MRLRLAALALLLVAASVHVGVTLPARRARDDAREAYARKREERERLRAEVARLEGSASVARPRAPEGDAAAARALRLQLIAATRGLPLGGVEVATRPGRRGRVAARGRLSGAGSQADLLRAANRLAEPASGAVLEKVSFVLGPTGLRLDADAFSVREGES
jgi:hypothetical protein